MHTYSYMSKDIKQVAHTTTKLIMKREPKHTCPPTFSPESKDMTSLVIGLPGATLHLWQLWMCITCIYYSQPHKTVTICFMLHQQHDRQDIKHSMRIARPTCVR